MTAIGTIWLVARRSRVAFAVALTAAVGALLGRGSTAPGFYEWRDRTAAVAAAFTLALPLLCGITAFAGGRLRRSTVFTSLRCAADGGMRAVVAFLGSMCLLAAGVAAIVIVTVFVPASPLAVPKGHPDWSWLLSSVVALLAAGILGATAGIVLPWWWCPPAMCVLSYATGVVVLVLGGAVTPTTPVLSPLFVASLGPFFALNEGLFLLRSLWFAGVALAGIGVSAALTTRSGRFAAIAGLTTGAILIGSGLGIIGSAHGVSLDRVSAPLRCAGTAPRLCLPPAFEPERGVIHDAVAPVARRVADTPFGFDRVELTERGPRVDLPDGAVELHIDDFAVGWIEADLGEMIQSMLDSRRPGALCSSIGPREPVGYVDGPPLVVIGWAIGSRETAEAWGGGRGGRAYDRLEAMTPTARAAWVSGAIPDLCRGTAPVASLR
jgi:hypothetical protein